jgi:hypothetical protein
VLKQDSVLERLMPALDFALGLRVIGGAADVLHFLLVQPLRGLCHGDIGLSNLWSRDSQGE